MTIIDRRRLLLAGTALAAALAAGPAGAAEPIRIGEINSYSGLPAFTLPYRNGWQLALAQINERGGVLGRPLEVISRDDGGKPGDALTAANELVARENVVLLMGASSPTSASRSPTSPPRSAPSTSPPSRSPTPSSGRRATATPSGCGPRSACRQRCWRKKRRSGR